MRAFMTRAPGRRPHRRHGPHGARQPRAARPRVHSCAQPTCRQGRRLGRMRRTPCPPIHAHTKRSGERLPLTLLARPARNVAPLPRPGPRTARPNPRRACFKPAERPSKGPGRRRSAPASPAHVPQHAWRHASPHARTKVSRVHLVSWVLTTVVRMVAMSRVPSAARAFSTSSSMPSCSKRLRTTRLPSRHSVLMRHVCPFSCSGFQVEASLGDHLWVSSRAPARVYTCTMWSAPSEMSKRLVAGREAAILRLKRLRPLSASQWS
mmetsp:Transcript_1203/g.3841  ORF Transcript_1203/g.3841 Transcript_1203/m.3841 type:complete len:265 (+) Transcript_1203:168-962(+)